MSMTNLYQQWLNKNCNLIKLFHLAAISICISFLLQTYTKNMIGNVVRKKHQTHGEFQVLKAKSRLLIIARCQRENSSFYVVLFFVSFVYYYGSKSCISGQQNQVANACKHISSNCLSTR